MSVLSVAIGVLTETAANAAPAPAPPSPASSVHLVAGSRSVTDARGQVWQPDTAYVRGGSATTSKATVNGTVSPALYRAQRSGAADYTIPVSQPGTYGVVLYVAELGGKSAGQRVFDVRAEDATASTVDVAAAAGKNAAWHVLFTTPVSDDALNLSLVARTGQPMVSAIAVDFMHSELSPTVTFDDEFSGEAGAPPADDHWTQNVFAGKNNELEYWNDQNSTTDGNGSLVIQARHETFTGPDGVTRGYTSGRLGTGGRFTWLYGTAEARILAPAGQGLWPSFWTTGTNGQAWPGNGEIDGMEMRGQAPSSDQGAVHGITTRNAEWTYHVSTSSPTPFAGQWHTYGMVWQPGVVATTVDGRTFMTVTPADLATTNIWPFDGAPFILRLQLAVGGDFVGAPNAATVFPANMLVDWVRVTQ